MYFSTDFPRWKVLPYAIPKFSFTHFFLIIMIIIRCSRMFRDVPWCSGMFRDVPYCMFYRRPLNIWVRISSWIFESCFFEMVTSLSVNRLVDFQSNAVNKRIPVEVVSWLWTNLEAPALLWRVSICLLYVGVSNGPIQFESARKFGLCSNCSQKLDECSLARARKVFASARML